MDLMTLIGIVLAFVALLVGSILKGAGLKGLLGGAAFMIVIVGTLASVMVQHPRPVLMRAAVLLIWLPPRA